MQDAPEVFVPLTNRPPRRDWRTVLWRLWCVLALICGWLVLIAGEREVHFSAAIFTVAGFYFVGRLIAWIFRPALSD